MGKQRTLSLVAAILTGLFLVLNLFSGFSNFRYGTGTLLSGLFFTFLLWGFFSDEKKAKEINKWVGLGMIIVSLSSYLGIWEISFFRVGVYSSFIYLPLGVICSIFGFFVSGESKEKVYNVKKVGKSMKLHHVFYVIGVLFIFGSVWYFAREFIAGLPDPIKLFLLVISFIVSFIIAEVLRSKEI